MRLAAAPRDTSWGSCRGARVLVVDDEELFRRMLVRRLNLAGCIAKGAASAMELVELLDRESFDLLLIDHHMPGPTGLRTLRRLRASHRLPAAILMTGAADIEIRVEALSLGTHVIEKPFEFEKLRRVAVLLLLSRRFDGSAAGSADHQEGIKMRLRQAPSPRRPR